MALFTDIANEADLEHLPYIIFSDKVLFPGGIRTLLLSHPVQIESFNKAFNQSKRFFFFAYSKEKKLFEKSLENCAPLGLLVQVKQVIKNSQGNLELSLKAIKRAKFEQKYFEDELSASFLENDTASSNEEIAQAKLALDSFQEYSDLSKKVRSETFKTILNASIPHQIADLIAAEIDIDYIDQVRLFTSPSSLERLRILNELLYARCVQLKLKQDIKQEISQKYAINQKTLFIQDQIAELQKELHSNNNSLSDYASLISEISQKIANPEILKRLKIDIQKIDSLSLSSPESIIAKNWLECLESLPWNKSIREELDLETIEKSLSKKHYALFEAKSRILEYMSALKCNPKLKSPILCLLGPPGTGKTSLAKGIAEALNRPFQQINLGGMHDEAELRGHRRTYVAALPGKIIQALRKTACNNPVILLDELDKISQNSRGDPASALLEILDPEQNENFVDHYVELPFDLSKILFIASANDLQNIPYALRDRLDLVQLYPYSRLEKLEIAKNHIIPKIAQDHTLELAQRKIEEKTLLYLIDNFTKEAGLRNLERHLVRLVRHALYKELSTKPHATEINHCFPQIKIQDIDSLLGASRIQDTLSLSPMKPGIVQGLAWSSMGGSLLAIETLCLEGSGKLKITGNLGNILKESVELALSVSNKFLQMHHLDFDFSKKDFHIHLPSGATPKDGPSAGLALGLSILSAALNHPISQTLAFSAELSLNGDLLSVGGLREKTLAAQEAGVKQVFLPRACELTMQALLKELKLDLDLQFASTFDEILLSLNFLDSNDIA